MLVFSEIITKEKGIDAMNAKVLGVLLAAGISVGASAGNVWWVDKAAGTDGDGRGKSDSTAFLTIQAAVNAAQSGDEIRVKPGVYDEGGGYYNNWNNRVLIQSKGLKIVSTGGKDVTHVVGVLQCEGECRRGVHHP